MSERDESTSPTTPESETKPGVRLARNMAFYTVIRLMLVLALTLTIIGLGMLLDVEIPILVAAIIAVVIALPLSMLLFSRMRAEINAGIAAVDTDRREKREDLHRRMDEA